MNTTDCLESRRIKRLQHLKKLIDVEMKELQNNTSWSISKIADRVYDSFEKDLSQLDNMRKLYINHKIQYKQFACWVTIVIFDIICIDSIHYCGVEKYLVHLTSYRNEIKKELNRCYGKTQLQPPPLSEKENGCIPDTYNLLDWGVDHNGNPVILDYNLSPQREGLVLLEYQEFAGDIVSYDYFFDTLGEGITTHHRTTISGHLSSGHSICIRIQNKRCPDMCCFIYYDHFSDCIIATKPVRHNSIFLIRPKDIKYICMNFTSSIGYIESFDLILQACCINMWSYQDILNHTKTPKKIKFKKVRSHVVYVVDEPQLDLYVLCDTQFSCLDSYDEATTIMDIIDRIKNNIADYSF